MLIFASVVRPTIFLTVPAEGSEEKTCNVTGKTVSAVVCVSWDC